jgi:hypothetical protein
VNTVSFLLRALAPPLALASAHAQHLHLNAGAPGSAPGAKLYFANGDALESSSGYTLPMGLATNGAYAGHYVGAITFTALAATPAFGGPAFAHAAPGARLALAIESVQGPSDGKFEFWDSDGEQDATQVTHSMPSGTTQGTVSFRLSENDGSPGADPYGHIHGRRFSTSAPGLYTITVRLFDTSTNGPSGLPLHPPSDAFSMHLQSGVTIAGLSVSNKQALVRFGTVRGSSYQPESAPEPSGPWAPVGARLPGNDHLQTFAVDATDRSRYFRLRVE